MLYDNGPLLALLANLWQASGDDAFRVAANETADWVLREMQDANGGLYASLDADSEGEEGKFYVWDPAAAEALLESDEYAVLAAHCGLDQPANFEGHWHLLVAKPLEDVAADQQIEISRARALLDAARNKLLAERDTRVWPGRDEKILTSWNALMIRGLAIAGRTLNRPDLIDAAAQAVALIRTELIVAGRLRASYKDNRARFSAYLDDHAFLLDALLELLQARWNSADLALAVKLADELLEHFLDSERGGFYFTANDHEALAHRSRTFGDDSLPSGNAIAAFALGRLGHLLGDTRYLDACEQTLKAGWPAMTDFPHGHSALVIALDEYLEAPEIVVIRGDAQAAEEWAATVNAKLCAAPPGIRHPDRCREPARCTGRTRGRCNCARLHLSGHDVQHTDRRSSRTRERTQRSLRQLAEL